MSCREHGIAGRSDWGRCIQLIKSNFIQGDINRRSLHLPLYWFMMVTWTSALPPSFSIRCHNLDAVHSPSHKSYMRRAVSGDLLRWGIDPCYQRYWVVLCCYRPGDLPQAETVRYDQSVMHNPFLVHRICFGILSMTLEWKFTLMLHILICYDITTHSHVGCILWNIKCLCCVLSWNAVLNYEYNSIKCKYR